MMIIPAAKIYFPPEDILEISDKVRGILDSGQLTLGEFTTSFETAFANYVGTSHAVAVNSGTSALEIALRVAGIQGREVLVPTNTNFATAAAVLHAGGLLRFIDLDPNTFSGTFESVIEATGPDTAGVIIVHIGGIITPEIDAIKNFCDQKGIFLLEDAAHAHGSHLNGRMAGSFGHVAAFSFFPTKVVTSAEGGMITTNDNHIAREARMYRDQGKSGSHPNLHVRLGNSWRMSELHALVGLTQLRRCESFVEHRGDIAKKYNDGIEQIEGVYGLALPPDLTCNYYKYIVMLDPSLDRQEIKVTLREQHGVNLSGEVYETPCHKQPVFDNRFLGRNAFPVADDVCRRHICLPISAAITPGEAEFVLQSLADAISG